MSIAIFGRIIGTKFKTAEELNLTGDKCLLEISISAPTGERKKEGQDYAPSNIYRVTLWDKRASALAPYAVEGKSAYVTGKLGVPNMYMNKDGEPACSLNIFEVSDIKMVNTVRDDAVEEAPAAAKATEKKTAKKATASKPDFDDIPF